MTGSIEQQIASIQIEPKSVEGLNFDAVSITYDDASDILYAYFFAEQVAPVSVLINAEDDVYALVDPETENLVGIQFDAFLTNFVNEYPQFILLGFLAGIPPTKFESTVNLVREDREDREPWHRMFTESIQGQIRQWLRSFHDTKEPATV